MIVLASGQIVLRNVFSIGIAWADGLIRLGILWLALLGAVAASRDRKHISIDVVTRLLPPPLQLVAAVVRDLFTATVCGLLAWYSWVFVSDSREFGDVLLDNWPAWWFQIVMPVGFALIAYRYLVRAAQSFRAPQ
jgi:TRAP-type C4-dicarboxylate transport system permease small subunit